LGVLRPKKFKKPEVLPSEPALALAGIPEGLVGDEGIGFVSTEATESLFWWCPRYASYRSKASSSLVAASGSGMGGSSLAETDDEEDKTEERSGAAGGGRRGA
jgi:hypothetical protein